jgi:fused signal recognition particle receptor
METLLVLVVVGVVLLLAAGLVVPRLRRGRPEPPPQAQGAPTQVREVDQDEVAVAEPETPAPSVEAPAPASGRLARLRQRLARSQSSLGRGLLSLLSRDSLDDEAWQDIEDVLLLADMGVGPTAELVERLRTQMRVQGHGNPDAIRELLRTELLQMLESGDRSLNLDGSPAVVLIVGVNGTGKTTTTGKLARWLIADDKSVVLGAADTFRAAAAEQLSTWGERVGAEVVRGADGADPASVAFAAVAAGRDASADVVVIDTAGRLHTKAGLMDELGKVQRVAGKQAPIREVLLVLDATTGQNGLVQARVFAESVNVTGVVLTKLDGTAKGGIVVAVQRELGVPVKFVGLGEGPDDLAAFEAAEFVDALLAD